MIEAERDEEPRWFLAAGAIAGVAFLAKYMVALYLVSLALGLVATAERRLLARWEPWAGALLALAIAAPNLFWQAENGWPFVAHTAVLAAEKNIPLSPVAFLVQEILTLGPATAPVWIVGIAAFAFWPPFARWRWIAVSWVLLVAAAVIGRGRPYYLAPAYPLLMAGGAVALEAWLPRLAKPAFAALVARRRRADRAAFPSGPAGRRLHRLRAGDRIHAQHRRTSAPRRRCRNITRTCSAGPRWPRQSAKPIRRSRRTRRKRAVFFAWNYGDAAAIDFFGAPWGLPPAISGHENYFLWGPRGADGSVVLILGGTREALIKLFRSVEPVGRFDHPLAVPAESGQTLWLCREILEPIDEVWPRLRHFS